MSNNSKKKKRRQIRRDGQRTGRGSIAEDLRLVQRKTSAKFGRNQIMR
jgi:hypothetical protein